MVKHAVRLLLYRKGKEKRSAENSAAHGNTLKHFLAEQTHILQKTT